MDDKDIIRSGSGGRRGERSNRIRKKVAVRDNEIGR